MTVDVHTARVRVPGTSANLGAGFDCIGMAVDRWLTASVEARDNVDSGGAAVTISRKGSLASMTLAPGMTAPDASVTVPMIEDAVPPWAHAAVPTTRLIIAVASHTRTNF